jgi:hypothetical protein
LLACRVVRSGSSRLEGVVEAIMVNSMKERCLAKGSAQFVEIGSSVNDEVLLLRGRALLQLSHDVAILSSLGFKNEIAVVLISKRSKSKKTKRYSST